MKSSVLSTVAAISLFLPVGAYAAQLHPQPTTNNTTNTIAQTPDVPPAEENDMRTKKDPMKMFEQLNLSSEQSEQIQTIQDNARTEHENLHEQLRQAKDQLRSLLASSDATNDQLQQQHQQVQSLKQQLDNQKFETMLQIREVLTPEQRTQMAEEIQQHHERRSMNH